MVRLPVFELQANVLFCTPPSGVQAFQDKLTPAAMAGSAEHTRLARISVRAGAGFMETPSRERGARRSGRTPHRGGSGTVVGGTGGRPPAGSSPRNAFERISRA